MKAAIRARLEKLVRLNRTRTDFAEKFDALIGSYDSGSRSIEELFEELLKLSKSLVAEQQRHVRENLSEEELTIFDILTRPAPDLSTAERDEVKKVAKDLLARLEELLVLNWRQRPRSDRDSSSRSRTRWTRGCPAPTRRTSTSRSARPSLARNHGFDARELTRIRRLIGVHRTWIMERGMTTAATSDPRIESVRVTSSPIVARLVDGRVISVPLAWSWRLSDATPAQRARHRLVGSGQGTHWPDVDEDISVESMLAGTPARRPRRRRPAERQPPQRASSAPVQAGRRRAARG